MPNQFRLHTTCGVFAPFTFSNKKSIINRSTNKGKMSNGSRARLSRQWIFAVSFHVAFHHHQHPQPVGTLSSELYTMNRPIRAFMRSTIQVVSVRVCVRVISFRWYRWHFGSGSNIYALASNSSGVWFAAIMLSMGENIKISFHLSTIY